MNRIFAGIALALWAGISAGTPAVPPTTPGIPVACSGPAAAANPFCRPIAPPSGGGGGGAVPPSGGGGGAVPPQGSTNAVNAPSTEQPAQQQQGGGKNGQLAGYIAMYITAQFFIFAICEKENIEWCKAPEWLRGQMDDPFDGARYGTQ